MYPLLFCSVLVVAVMLERLGAFRRARVDVIGLMDRLRQVRGHDAREEALRICRETPLPLGPEATAGLEKAGRRPEDVDDAMANAGALALQDLESNLPILGTIGGTAPFIGLFGTVVGIMRAFHNIRVRGHAGTAVVAGGVSEALIATAAGLLVAVVAVVAYNAFLNRVSRLETRLDAARSELLFFFTEEWDCARVEKAALRGRG